MSKSTPTTEAREVPLQLERYGTLLDELHDAIASLQDRVNPVANYKDEIGQDKAKPSDILCPIATELDSKNDGLAEKIESIRRITRSIEV